MGLENIFVRLQIAAVLKKAGIYENRRVRNLFSELYK